MSFADHIIIRIFVVFVFTMCGETELKKKRKFLYANYRENCASKEGKAA